MSYYQITLPRQQIKIVATNHEQAREIVLQLTVADLLNKDENEIPAIEEITREDFEM